MSSSLIVKFCGFREQESITGLSGLTVNMAGFILAPSKRRVPIDQMRELLAAVPFGVKKVGVFVNPSVTEIEDVFRQGKLDVIQLHGSEPPEYCAWAKQRFGVEVIKAWHIGEDEELVVTSKLNGYKEIIDYLLLDTYDAKQAGGTGKAFRWDKLPAYYDWCEQAGIKLIVAGGIHMENVKSLINHWPLHGIDVSSGIETDGSKDIIKMREMIERVRGNVYST